MYSLRILPLVTIALALAGTARGDERPAVTSWDPAKTRLVVAGVLEWKNPGFAPFSKANRKDQELYDVLIGRGVPESHARLLLDEDATRAGILAALRDAARKTAADETLIFYFAGHGTNRDGRCYLANYDAGNDPETTSIPVTEVASILRKEFHGRRVLLLADCCHSGGLRDAAKAVSDEHHEAAALTSVSPERTSTGNWTFTETLLDGFRGRYTVDRNADGSVTFQELADDVHDAMLHVEKQPFGFANYGVPKTFVISPRRGAAPTLPAGSKFRLGQFVTARDSTGWVKGRLIGRAHERWQVELQSYSTRPVLTVTDDEIDDVDPVPYAEVARDHPAHAEVPLAAGSEVLVEWGKQMWPAKILAIDAKLDRYHIHYIGWPDSDDEWATHERVARLETPLEPYDALVDWKGFWWPAKILSEKKGRFRVHYVGWNSHWDESVGQTRVRKQPAK